MNTYDYSGPMGVKDLAAGTCARTWFDTVSRTQTETGVIVTAGESTWSKPTDSRGTAGYPTRRNLLC